MLTSIKDEEYDVAGTPIFKCFFLFKLTPTTALLTQCIIVTNIRLHLSYHFFPLCLLSRCLLITPPHLFQPALTSCCGNPVFCLALNTFRKPMSKGGVTHTLTFTHTHITHSHNDSGLEIDCVLSLLYESSSIFSQISKKRLLPCIF